MVLLAIFSISQSVWSSWRKLNSLKGSEAEIERLKAENKKLEEEKTFRQSNFYVEKEAREKLGLARDGETVYLREKAASEAAQNLAEKEAPNWQAWIELFSE